MNAPPASVAADHGRLMDAVYRRQRHVYDLTRKYFLFGRDRLIGDLALGQGGSLLELGCGTGRNLALVQRCWPAATLHGIDISAEMLRSASSRLGSRAVLARGDACHFDAATLLGRDTFDRVIVSYALSMIPDWTGAMAQGLALLAPGGSLHVVDFGGASGLPGPIRHGLMAWLARFHVTPRENLAAEARAPAGWAVEVIRGPFDYYQILRITRPA
jgi:S-adenosylmethionine-diacylgycerolhomoserine-N-methlytransferase